MSRSLSPVRLVTKAHAVFLLILSASMLFASGCGVSTASVARTTATPAPSPTPTCAAASLVAGLALGVGDTATIPLSQRVVLAPTDPRMSACATIRVTQVDSDSISVDAQMLAPATNGTITAALWKDPVANTPTLGLSSDKPMTQFAPSGANLLFGWNTPTPTGDPDAIDLAVDGSVIVMGFTLFPPDGSRGISVPHTLSPQLSKLIEEAPVTPDAFSDSFWWSTVSVPSTAPMALFTVPAGAEYAFYLDTSFRVDKRGIVFQKGTITLATTLDDMVISPPAGS